MDKLNKMKSINSKSKENKQLMRKIIKQKNRYKSIDKFKKDNPDLTADFLYQIRLEDPKLKKHVLENRLKLKINDYMKEQEETEKNNARLAKNRKIIEQQDAKAAMKKSKKEKRK